MVQHLICGECYNSLTKSMSANEAAVLSSKVDRLVSIAEVEATARCCISVVIV